MRALAERRRALMTQSETIVYSTITFPSGMSLADGFPTLAENAGIDLDIQLVLQKATNVLSNNQTVAALTSFLLRIKDNVIQNRAFRSDYYAVIKPADEFYVVPYDDDTFASEFCQVENIEEAISGGGVLKANMESFSASFPDGYYFVWRLKTIAQVENYGFFCTAFKKTGSSYSFIYGIRVVNGEANGRELTNTWTFYVNNGDKLAFYKLA